MKNRLTGLFALSVLILVLSPASPAAGERHPQIRPAMRVLGKAKEHLEHAAYDFGGHRVEAFRAIDHAHHQLDVSAVRQRLKTERIRFEFGWRDC